MTISAQLQEKLLEYLSDGKNHSVKEMKEYLRNVNFSNYTEGHFAGSLHTLVNNGSIKSVSRGIYVIKRGDNMKMCFVVSPVGDAGSKIRERADKLFKYIINPVCEECNFKAIRVDKLNDANSITQTIIEYLETADLVIADISGHNPNVFYEMGYRTRTEKPIIHLKSKNEKIPFDINTIRTFEYDLTDLDSVDEIKKRLIKTIKSFDYKEDTKTNNKENESAQTSIMPVLYQILDSLSSMKSDIKNLNKETIKTIINTMQDSKPQVSSDVALQMQLFNSLLNNPESVIKLAKLSKEFETVKK